MHNPALQPTGDPLRRLPAAELGRYATLQSPLMGVELASSFDAVVNDIPAERRTVIGKSCPS